MIKKCATLVYEGKFSESFKELKRHVDIKVGTGNTIGGGKVAEINLGRTEHSLVGLALGERPEYSVGYSALVGYQATFETKKEIVDVKQLKENEFGVKSIVTDGSYIIDAPDNSKPPQEEFNVGPVTQNTSTGALSLSFSISLIAYAEIELNLTNLFVPEEWQVIETVNFEEYRKMWEKIGNEQLRFEPARAN